LLSTLNRPSADRQRHKTTFRTPCITAYFIGLLCNRLSHDYYTLSQMTR